MKAFRLAGVLLALAAGQAHASVASGRLLVTVRQCVAVQALAPEACRTAFANVTAEFAAKVPHFASRRACFRAYGPCMPWPPGTRRYDEFRPQLVGVTLQDGSGAMPAIAPGRLRFDFTPQSTATLSPAAASVPASTGHDDPGAAPTILSPAGDDEADPGPSPRAGGGFTMIDGVLSYPAPARFQPKALKHP